MDHPEYVFYGLPSEVWAVQYTNIQGDRVVQVMGTEYAARQAAEQYAVAGAVLMRANTQFRPVSNGNLAPSA